MAILRIKLTVLSGELFSAQRFQNFRGVAFGRHFVPGGADFSVGADPVRHAHDSQERFTQETFHAPRAVRLDYFEFRVGEQRESQLVL